MRKEYTIIIIIALVVIISTVVLINLFAITEEASDDTFTSTTAPIYLSNIEATVLSIELDELENEDCGLLFETSTICPRDKAIIRIDSLENIDSPGTQLLEVGSEVVVYFKYSARPAKLMKDRKDICEGLPTDECPPTSVIYVPGEGECRLPDGTVIDCSSIYLEDKPTEIQEGFIIYHFAKYAHKPKKDVVLPGVQEGNQIKFSSSVMSKDYAYAKGFEADSQIYDIEVYELIR